MECASAECQTANHVLDLRAPLAALNSGLNSNCNSADFSHGWFRRGNRINRQNARIVQGVPRCRRAGMKFLMVSSPWHV
jgi:hypothetical protein